MAACCAARQVIAKCHQSNTAARKELDWQGQLEALMDARRLVAHHAEVSF
jgi:thiamine biosynthesis protein ThiC